jgi:hypothetical protein
VRLLLVDDERGRRRRGLPDVVVPKDAQLFKRRSIQRRAAVPVVDVFLDEDVACGSDLPFQLDNLTLNCSLFLLRICAHTRVQGGLCHTLH